MTQLVAAGATIRAVTRSAVEKRLKMLAYLEGLNVLFVPGFTVFIFVAYVGRLPGLGVLWGLVATCLVLYQGTVYWFWKLASVQGDEKPFPLAKFHRWEKANIPAFAVLLVLVCLEKGRPDLWVGLGFWILGVLEHVNYFKVQLMHDNGNDWRRLIKDKGLRKSSLRKDMDRAVAIAPFEK